LFSQGSTDEAVRWFSKCLMLIDAKRVADVPNDLNSIIHSNRAFAYIKLNRWSDAEADCCKSLALNERNTKAKYRRALACFELQKTKAALEDVEHVLKEMPDPSKNKEASELKARILKALEETEGGAKPTAKPTSASPAAGFTKLEIVEVSDDSEEDADKSDQFPDLKIECTWKGLEKAKDHANGLFSKGSTEEAVRWFSKCIWLVDSNRIEDVFPSGSSSTEFRSILHANRAFAYNKLKQWSDADRDCSAALILNPKNIKAMWRRAVARSELDNLQGALADVDAVLAAKPDDKEATALRARLLQRMPTKAPQTTSPTAASSKPSSPKDSASSTCARCGAAICGAASVCWSCGSGKADDRAPQKQRGNSAPEAGVEDVSVPEKAPRARPAGLVEAAAPAAAEASSSSKPGSLRSKASTPSGTPPDTPLLGTPTGSPTSTTTTTIGRAAAAASRAVPTPSVPATPPRNSFELLRNFNSLRRYPVVLARYVKERVSPQSVYSLFSRSPIEPDDLATLLAALRLTDDVSGEPLFDQELRAEYLRQLVRTNTSDMQFAMLSTSEKEDLRELMSSLPASDPGRKTRAFLQKAL